MEFIAGWKIQDSECGMQELNDGKKTVAAIPFFLVSELSRKMLPIDGTASVSAN